MDVTVNWITNWMWSVSGGLLGKIILQGFAYIPSHFKKLTPATVYTYKIVLVSGEIREGTFKTLSDNPEKIRIVTLSDSHLFKISREFTEMVFENRPDLMIHSGDISSLATGYQKDDYTTNWFKPRSRIFKEIPVVYTSRESCTY